MLLSFISKIIRHEVKEILNRGKKNFLVHIQNFVVKECLKEERKNGEVGFLRCVLQFLWKGGREN